MAAPNLRAVDATLPDPPYPEDIKANGYSPKVDWQLIKASTTWRICPPDMRNNLLRIWMESWNEVPAGSWENNEQLLAGVTDIPQGVFDRYRDIFLRGWAPHSDGRLYHQTITRFVEDMIIDRKNGNARQRRYREKLKARRASEATDNETGSDPKVTRDKRVSNASVTRESRVSNASVTRESRVCNGAEGKGRDGKGREWKERNRHVENLAEKPENCIAAVERDAPDRCVSDVQTKTKTPERVVFEYWQSTMGHPRAKLDTKRRKAIKGRLNDGYAVADICTAIDGCKGSEFHQGKNDRKTVFDDIELICRDVIKLDAFIVTARKASDDQAQMNDFLSGTTKSVLFGDFENDHIDGECHEV